VPGRPDGVGRGSGRSLAAAAGAAALASILLSGCSTAESRGGIESVPAAAATAGPVPTFESYEDVPTRRPLPVRLRIPSLQVDAPVGTVGKVADGSVEVPERWEEVGWYDGGARPGEDGPAVLLGHVDSKAGPAVFVRLPQVQMGAVVEVVDAEGGVARFAVDRVEQYPKTRFPTEAVYLPLLRPELRLVTCGGAFDRATGHYVDNIIVYASPVA
jgi:sortase (surface protein transpeptidase)